MIKITICFVIILMFASFAQAQKVPKAIEAQIQKELDCDDSELSVSSVKIGPSKYGYEGSCDYPTNVYEKTGNGIRKIFEGEYGMRGGMGFSKKVYNGYYEIDMFDSVGPYLKISETYRYDGSKYVRYKCVEWNFENSKKPRRQACNF